MKSTTHADLDGRMNILHATDGIVISAKSHKGAIVDVSFTAETARKMALAILENLSLREA